MCFRNYEVLAELYFWSDKRSIQKNDQRNKMFIRRLKLDLEGIIQTFVQL